MDHPVREDANKGLRGRMVSLLTNGYNIIHQSNIVFVCGGNEPHNMRTKFETAFETLLPEYEFFKPEFAMENYFSFGDTEPFDIADFESMVADLHSAVLFPNAWAAQQEKQIEEVLSALDPNAPPLYSPSSVPN